MFCFFCRIGEQAQGRLGHDCFCACDEWPQQRSGFTTCCDDAGSDACACVCVALRKERGGTTRLLPAYTEFGIPADVQVFVLWAVTRRL